MTIARRPLLLALAAAGLTPRLAGAQAASAAPGRAAADNAGALSPLSAAPLRFPRDHGAHPETQVEWWYVTGVLRGADTPDSAPPAYGFQLTFFRVRHDLKRPLDSAFAPGQLMLGHAAVSDLGRQRLLHDQRVLRHGFANARTETSDTAVRLGDWRLNRKNRNDRQDGSEGPDGVGTRSRYDLLMRSETAGFALKLSLAAPQVPLLQGQAGWSRKGPGEQQASRYVSEPQLAGNGRLALRDGGTREVRARAWLDHEWSNQYLGRGAEAGADQAVGWDWLGLNLDDGSALTLFQMRGPAGQVVWTGGSWRDPASRGGAQIDLQEQLRFEPLASWRSPVSLATYPVRWRIHTPRGALLVEAVYDAQEIDARRSTGFPYWEGVARVADATGRTLGWGYLEMTGYAGRVPL